GSRMRGGRSHTGRPLPTGMGHLANRAWDSGRWSRIAEVAAALGGIRGPVPISNDREKCVYREIVRPCAVGRMNAAVVSVRLRAGRRERGARDDYLLGAIGLGSLSGAAALKPQGP